MKNIVEQLKHKINMCATYSNLFALEKQFNKVGLTIQTTTRNRIVLCKIKDGKPYCENICEDYIFVGSFDNGDQVLNDRVVSCLIEFIEQAASKPAVLHDEPRSWQKHTSLYGNLFIVNEDIEALSQEFID